MVTKCCLAKKTIIEVNNVEWLQSAAPDGTRESRGEEYWNKVKKKQDSARFSPLQLCPFAPSHLLTCEISLLLNIIICSCNEL